MQKMLKNILEEYEKEDFSQLTFYHGTSDIFEVKEILPSSETFNLREDWRKKYQDKVFLITSLLSAKQYAKKAASKFGGNPIVYEVKPNGDIWHTHTNEYVADSAEILKKVEI